MVEYGRRNIALLTIAPTGTTSLMTQTTSGIEPVFLPVYKRRRKVNPSDKGVRVDYTDEVGDSWEEYLVLKDYYGDRLYLVAVHSSPETRYARLGSRLSRPLTVAEAASRDWAEIENVNKGGPIAMANFTVINEASLEDLQSEVNKVIKGLS